jgi:hypothetical protein
MAGKGKEPIKGYNWTNWYKNHGKINWGHKPPPKPKKEKQK